MHSWFALLSVLRAPPLNKVLDIRQHPKLTEVSSKSIVRNVAKESHFSNARSFRHNAIMCFMPLVWSPDRFFQFPVCSLFWSSNLHETKWVKLYEDKSPCRSLHYHGSNTWQLKQNKTSTIIFNLKIISKRISNIKKCPLLHQVYKELMLSQEICSTVNSVTKSKPTTTCMASQVRLRTPARMCLSVMRLQVLQDFLLLKF